MKPAAPVPAISLAVRVMPRYCAVRSRSGSRSCRRPRGTPPAPAPGCGDTSHSLFGSGWQVENGWPGECWRGSPLPAALRQNPRPGGTRLPYPPSGSRREWSVEAHSNYPANPEMAERDSEPRQLTPRPSSRGRVASGPCAVDRAGQWRRGTSDRSATAGSLLRGRGPRPRIARAASPRPANGGSGQSRRAQSGRRLLHRGSTVTGMKSEHPSQTSPCVRESCRLAPAAWRATRQDPALLRDASCFP